MATTPADLTVLNAAQLAAISRARGIIDAELRLRYAGPFPIKIRRGIIEFLFKENEQVLNAVLDEYRSAGWEVVAYSSSDQGDWFSFYHS
jgi:hypothetical protein